MFIGLCGSYTEKIPHKRHANPKAFPKLNLYLNLLHVSQSEDDLKYEFAFRASDMPDNPDEYWFKVGRILQMREDDAVREFKRASPHRDSAAFDDNLSDLHNAVWNRDRIHFYTETRTDLDEVLRIFIRLNSGGVTLNYSDLLFSLVTASWKTHDARESIHALVDELNSGQGASFGFDKDFVLRALLVCRGGDVRFRTINFGQQQNLEEIWIPVAEAMRQAVRILVRMGFRWETLRAPNAIHALVYYLYLISDSKAVESDRCADDREAMRLWLLRCFIGQVFSGSSDRLLKAIRDAIDESWKTGARKFPAGHIDQVLSNIRGVGFNEDVIAQAVDGTYYGSPDAFYLLSLIAPAPRGHVSAFDVDHLHPRSLLDAPDDLKAAGLSDDDVQFLREHVNCLPNLHLLTEAENRGQKKARPLKEWLDEQPSALWINQSSFLPATVSTELRDFRAFYGARRTQLLTLLRQALGLPTLFTAVPINTPPVSSSLSSTSTSSSNSP